MSALNDRVDDKVGGRAAMRKEVDDESKASHLPCTSHMSLTQVTQGGTIVHESTVTRS